MSTDFSYGGQQIVSGGPFKPGGKDMPNDARTRVDCYADIATIPNPYVGLKITVKVDETNNNKMTDYIVKSLKANSIGIANSLIDEVVRYVDYLGVSSSGGGTGLTTEQANNIAKIPAIQSTVDALPNNYASKNHNHSEYASSSHRHDASEIDNLPSGGGTGLTTEQANNIAKIPNIENSLKSIDAISLNGKKFSDPMTKAEYDALLDKDPNTIYLIEDDTAIEGVPSYSANDAGKVLAVNSDGTSLIFMNISSTGLDIRDVETNEIFTVSNAEENIPVYGNIVLSTTSLSINEDSTGSFTVSLSTAPTNNQVVNISVDNNNCTVNKSSLTFTPDNYATAQTVTVNAVHNSTNYSDLTSIVTLTSDNVTTQKVNVTITNIDVEKELSSINAVYTQGNTAIYPSTSLDSLKASLVVTATYSDNTSSNVTDYSLSGTLTEGTSTITVIYREKTATFDVTVSAENKSNNFVSLETINDINYLSLATEKSSDGTPVNYLTLTEKTSYATELYRYFYISINGEMALPLNKYSDFSSYIINGYTENTNFNTWRSDSNIEESLMIYSNMFYCKVAKTNIGSEATMDEIFKYINNNILQHNNLKINASGLKATLTSREICSYIDSSATISLSKNGNNVLIRTASSPFGSSISGAGLLNNYDWYGVPLNESRADNSGFAISNTSSNNRFHISIPIEHFTNDNLELTTENCKTIINNYYSDIKVYSWASLATS